MSIIISDDEVLQSLQQMDGRLTLVQEQDFQPIIDLVLQRRAQLGDKFHLKDDTLFDGPAFILPLALADLLKRHGIKTNGFANQEEQTEHFNFILDWLKENFPCFLIFPNKNLKRGRTKATPTKPIVLDKRNITV